MNTNFSTAAPNSNPEKSRGRTHDVLLVTNLVLLGIAAGILLSNYHGRTEFEVRSTLLGPVTTAVTRGNPINGRSAEIALAPKPHKSTEFDKKIAQLSDRVKADRTIEAYHDAYGPLIRQLGLDTLTAVRFTALLYKERGAAADALKAAKANHVESPQDYVASVKEAVAVVDLQMQSLLSPEAFKQFTDYRATLPEQATMRLVANSIANSAIPLNEIQHEQIAETIRQMLPQEFKQNQEYLGMIGVDSVPLTSAMVRASANILTPTQLRAFESIQKYQHSREEMLAQLLAKIR